MVLTLVVMNELLTGHPVRALVSQQRLHPAGVVSVGAEDPSGEVTLGGGDIHAVIRDVPDRAAGIAERDMALLSECVCIHTPDSSSDPPEHCRVLHACSRPLRWVPLQDQVHVVGCQTDIGGFVHSC